MSAVDPYDWDAFEANVAARPATRRRSRGGAPAAVLAAALRAVDDVALGERSRTPIVEEAEIPGPDPSQRVVVHVVPGDPHLSWALVRPE